MSGDGLTVVAIALVIAGTVGFNYNQSHTEPKLQSLEQKVVILEKQNEQLKREKDEAKAQLQGALMIRR